jgi:hypothetical protein
VNINNQNFIHEEIKARLNSENAWYHAVQNILFTRLLSKTIKIKMSIILPVFMGVKHGLSLRLFENRVLKRIFGFKRDEAQLNGKSCIMRSFLNFTLQILA